MDMRFKARVKFWQIIVGVIALAIFFGTIWAITHSISEGTESSKKAVERMEKNHAKSYLPSLHMFIYILVFFYFTINYFYRYIALNKRWYAFPGLIAVLLVADGFYHAFMYNNFPQVFFRKYDSIDKLFSVMLTNAIPMMLVAFIFAFGIYLWESQKQRRILEAQKLQLETQISQANFNFLKAQINPHFLHNTLNFLYAKSLPYSPELSEGILTLSDIMRYALNQGNLKDGKAPLKDEIEHVNNVIRISQLRYSNELRVNFEVKGDLEGKFIIPFVLITIVENAFKHGDLKNPDYPIVIKVEVSGTRLYFYCSNRKKIGPKQLSTGIGLENIKKRLDLAYGNKYRFTVKEDPDFYTTELTIDPL